jgi:hypothetical protein
MTQDGKTALEVIASKDTEADLFLLVVAPSVTRMWKAGEEVPGVRTLLAPFYAAAHIGPDACGRQLSVRLPYRQKIDRMTRLVLASDQQS